MRHRGLRCVLASCSPCSRLRCVGSLLSTGRGFFLQRHKEQKDSDSLKLAKSGKITSFGITNKRWGRRMEKDMRKNALMFKDVSKKKVTMTNSTIATKDSIMILFQGNWGQVGHQPLLQTTVKEQKHPKVEALASWNIHQTPYTRSPLFLRTNLVASLRGLTEWQAEWGGKLAAAHIRRVLCHSRVTWNGDRLSLTTANSVYFWNKTSLCQPVLPLLGEAITLSRRWRSAWSIQFLHIKIKLHLHLVRLLWSREELNSTGLTSYVDHRISVFMACRKTKAAADELWTQQPGLLDLLQTCSLPRCLATNTASIKLLSQISNALYGFMLMISTYTHLILRMYATNQKWNWKGEPDSSINNSLGKNGNLEGWRYNVWLNICPRQGFCDFYTDSFLKCISYLKRFFFKTLYNQRPFPHIISWWWNNKTYLYITMTGYKGLSRKGGLVKSP